jgi:hypothetical protein
MIPDLSFRNWCLLFGDLPDPVEDLPFAIVIEGVVLSAASAIVEPVREGRLNAGSWTIKCSRQGTNIGWDVMIRFCEICHK